MPLNAKVELRRQELIKKPPKELTLMERKITQYEDTLALKFAEFTVVTEMASDKNYTVFRKASSYVPSRRTGWDQGHPCLPRPNHRSQARRSFAILHNHRSAYGVPESRQNIIWAQIPRGFSFCKYAGQAF